MNTTISDATTKMDKELKAKWIEALRSGKYKQTKGALKRGNGFCCLGVLCDIQGADFVSIKEEFGTLSLSSNPVEYIGMLGGRACELTHMNDKGNSFSEIADYIEREL